MKRLLFICIAIVLLAACKEKRCFTDVTGEIHLVRIGFEDKSFRDFTVVSDVLYAGSDTSSRYKMIFYLPDGWDNSYPIFLDRYVPTDGQAWTAYQGMPVAEAALNRGDMIVVLLAYNEGTAIPDILLAEHFLKEHDTDLPGDSKNILTAAYFDFE
jgi:hypothetical protein